MAFWNILVYCSEKIRLEISCEPAILADNSHDMASGIFSQYKKTKFLTHLCQVDSST